MPTPAAGQVLIRIRAAGVNPADWKWRAGMFAAQVPIPLPHVPGYDVAGTIEQVGQEVHSLSPGDRVFALLDPIAKGGYAEFVICESALVARIPDGMSFAVAAALPTPALTGCQMVTEHMPSEGSVRVLITGAVGAVGRFALYQAKQMGAYCIAAVRAGQAAQALALGADEVVALDDPEAAVPAIDFVADTVGGSEVARLCRGLAVGGKIITVSTSPIDAKDLAVTPTFIAVHADTSLLERIARAVNEGAITLAALAPMPLDQAAEAHRLIEAGSVGAKIILEP
jgi:NADPH:quinone reductase-like Zn-dependent oxidoreductase